MEAGSVAPCRAPAGRGPDHGSAPRWQEWLREAVMPVPGTARGWARESWLPSFRPALLPGFRARIEALLELRRHVGEHVLAQHLARHDEVHGLRTKADSDHRPARPSLTVLSPCPRTYGLAADAGHKRLVNLLRRQRLASRADPPSPTQHAIANRRVPAQVPQIPGPLLPYLVRRSERGDYSGGQVPKLQQPAYLRLGHAERLCDLGLGRKKPGSKPAPVAHTPLVRADVLAHSVLDIHLDQRIAVIDLPNLNEQFHAELS